MPNSTFEIYAPSFIEKFFESHTVMFQGNSGLKPKEGEVTSQPWQWPINYRVRNIGSYAEQGHPLFYPALLRLDQ